MATISGFSILVFGFGIRELRSWNRISVFIAFFVFATVAYGLDWLRRRLPARWWTTPAVAIGLAVILLVGLLDQVSPAVIPDYDGHRGALEQRRVVRGRIERDLPGGRGGVRAAVPLLPRGTADGDARSLRPRPAVPAQRRAAVELRRDARARRRLAGEHRGAPRAPDARPRGRDRIRRAALRHRQHVQRRRGIRRRHLGRAGHRRLDSASDLELAFWDLRDYRRELRDRIGADGVRELRRRALADRSVPAATRDARRAAATSVATVERPERYPSSQR